MLISNAAKQLHYSFHFATSTPYRMKKVEDDKQSLIGLKVVNIQLVQRHGARYPTLNTIYKIDKVTQFLKSNDFYYTNPFPKELHGELCERGNKELNMLARYYSHLFPSILSYPSYLFKISSSHKKRAQDSAKRYVEGLFHNDIEKQQQVKKLLHVNNKKDNLLFFQNDPEYVKHVSDKNTLKEVRLFENKTMDKLSLHLEQNLYKQLGKMPKHFNNITFELLLNTFKAGMYEYVVSNHSNLLDLFSINDVYDYEYRKDIDSYYMKGRIHRINYKIACPLLHNIMNDMKNAMICDQKNKMHSICNLRFGHAETVTPLMSLLDLNTDRYHITSSLTKKQRDNRLWKQSIISPFSSHLLFVLLKDNQNRYFIKTYLNQIPQHYTIPNKQYLTNHSNYLYPASTLLSFFENKINELK